MSRNKRANGADEIYQRHLYGSPFANNPVNDRNAMTERLLMRVIMELAMNRFKWSGLPESIDVRWLEYTLLYRALSIFYFDKDYGQYLALQGGGNNFLNMMGNPTGFVVVGANFASKQISAIKETDHAGKGIPIWANYMRVPDMDIVMVYATKLANYDRTIEINGANARQNKYVIATETQRLSMVNINRQIDEGQNLIQLNGGVMQDLENIKAVDLGIHPDTIEKMSIVRARLWNECMGLLGIENANQDKKERLVSAEVDANDEQTSSMKYVNLNARRQACELINKEYGLNVKVDYNTEIDKRATAMFESSLNDDKDFVTGGDTE